MTPQSASFTPKATVANEYEPQWFAITVRPQHEASVAQGLAIRGIEQFSPTYVTSREHVRADRRDLRCPLFPGYVFSRFVQRDRSAVKKTPGVTSIVGFGGVPLPVPDVELERVRALLASDLPVRPRSFLNDGDRVRIAKGPLRGLEGIVIRRQSGYEFVVSVTFLQRSVSVTIDPHSLAPSDL